VYGEGDFGPFDGPIVVGWREHVVKARIRRLLSSESPSDSSTSVSSLTVAEVFPGCSDEDVALFDRVLANLDGSLAGMRGAMMDIFKLSDLATENSIIGRLPERKIYIGLLTIVGMFRASKLLAPVLADVPGGLTKVSPTWWLPEQKFSCLN
jgi:hypothetical protein